MLFIFMYIHTLNPGFAVQVRLPRKMMEVDVMCPICMNAIDETMIIADCMHRFCSDCINQSLRLSKKVNLERQETGLGGDEIVAREGVCVRER